MREMKDSGIEWVGEIPVYWTYARIGSLYGLRTEKVSDRDYQPLSVTKLGILPQIETAAKTNAHDDRKLVKKGDFAINSRSDRRGSCGISEYDGSVSLINTVLYPTTKMDPQYYNWLFHTTEFADEFYRWGHGIVDDLWTTGWQDMKSIVIIQPPLSEQRRIAAFLDAKCAEIDALTADIVSQIDTLEQYKRSVITEAVTKGLNPDAEMKDSGIEWIGEIPGHWTINKMKYLFANSKGLSITKENLIETGLPVVSYGQIHSKSNSGTDIQDDLLRFVDFQYQKKYPQCEVFQYDFVFADTSEDYEGCGNCIYKRDRSLLFGGYHTIILHSLEKEDNRFLAYLFKTDVWRKQLREVASGVKVFSITQKTLMNSSVIIPPRLEQKAISDYLDAKCAEIDALTADIVSQIDTLEQYKRSVITEAVTKGLNPDAEMKDSGVQWIGKIPFNWDVIRGKYILQYMQKPVREDDGVITCFRNGEVTLRSNRREDGFTMSDKEIGYQGIDVGDLVVHGMDGFAGSIGISDSRGKASPVLNVLDTKQNKRYIMYYLRSMAYSDVFLAMATGIRVRSCDLRWNKLAELSYPVPPIEDQNAIVEYIDSAIKKMDAVIADKKAQIDVIDEYKKSLIFEYVTGKKEVPGA